MMKRSLIFSFLLVFVTLTHAQKINLDFYLNKALQNSPLLKDYQGQIVKNRIDSMRIRAVLRPQVTAISNNSYAPIINGWGFDEAITNGANVSALLNVSKEVTGRYNRQNRYEALNLLNQSVLNEGKISEQDLRKSIITQYITAYGEWQQYNFNTELVNILNKEEKILKELAEKGVYKQTDYLSFMINLQQQEMTATQLKIQYRSDFAILNYLCGIEDTTFVELPDPELKVESFSDFNNTVFYRQFFIDSLKLRNAEKQIGFGYKPKISLMADGGYYSSLAFNPGKNFGIDAGVSITIPIFDGRQRKMQYDRIAIDEQTRKNYLDHFNVQYRQQLNRLIQQLDACQKLSDQISNQIAYTHALMQADHKLLENGDLRIDEYIMSIGAYLNANYMMIENNISKYFIANEINYWNKAK
jgi:outer membrane protein TolC